MRWDVNIECVGKWASILVNVGYQADLFSGKNQPCPYCAGRDRFRWDRNREFGICNQCGDHQPMTMAMYMLNADFKTAVEFIRPGAYKMEPVPTAAPDLAKRKERLESILKGCKRITPDTVAGLYLASRCITEVPEADCFYHPALEYFNSDGARRGDHPAIVSRIRTPEGNISTFQILYLTHDGQKLNAPDCRKILPVIAPMKGGAIRLYEATEILCIAEGLESAMSVRVESGMPVWSAINAGNMEAIIIPESVKHVYIYSDMDKSGTGVKSAAALYHKLLMKGGMEVILVILHEQKQIILKPENYDFNDYMVLQAASGQTPNGSILGL